MTKENCPHVAPCTSSVTTELRAPMMGPSIRMLGNVSELEAVIPPPDGELPRRATGRTVWGAHRKVVDILSRLIHLLETITPTRIRLKLVVDGATPTEAKSVAPPGHIRQIWGSKG